MIQSRGDIFTATRIVIKAGTSVVSTPDGYPSLSRIANIVENAARLAKEGKQVLIVTSGTPPSGIYMVKYRSDALIDFQVLLVWVSRDFQDKASCTGLCLICCQRKSKPIQCLLTTCLKT